MDAIETFEHNGKIIEIHQDENPQNPREDGVQDNLDVMICFHTRYNLGDKHSYKTNDYNGWDEIEDQIIKDHDPIAIRPLYLYDHSGITISTSPFSCRWDSGQVGFVFIPKQKMLKEWNKKRVSKKLKQKALDFLEDSVKSYDQYLRNDIYGYIIKDQYGNELDSCWGFYGMDEVREEAKGVAGNMNDQKVAIPA